MKERRWYYLMPLIGVVFLIRYVFSAFYDVVYSDYIRLVNSYLPDVWNAAKFFVPDILTRTPVTYLARIINTTFFNYQISFDQVSGVLWLGVCAALVVAYGNKRNIRLPWIAAAMAALFSLGKWEMLINGSAWVHFLAFAGFYYHYLILDRVWSGEAKKNDRKKLLCLPWILILFVTGPYCAIYVMVIWLSSALKCLLTWLEEKRFNREYAEYAVSAAVPFFLYLLSNAAADGTLPAGAYDIPLLTQLLDTPGFFARFILKSFASVIVDAEYARSAFSTNTPYLVLGMLVIAAYVWALWYQYRYRLYEESILPLLFIGAGGMNHLLILLARWNFLDETYGMSSRYALQFQTGILGIFLTFALVWKKQREGAEAGGKKNALRSVRIVAARGLMLAFIILVVDGNIDTTRRELDKAYYRRAVCVERAMVALDFENKTDDELRKSFEFRTSLPESGQMVRNALTILKENGWNIFRDGVDAEALKEEAARLAEGR